mgnify:CR=1 FL=1
MGLCRHKVWKTHSVGFVVSNLPVMKMYGYQYLDFVSVTSNTLHILKTKKKNIYIYSCFSLKYQNKLSFQTISHSSNKLSTVEKIVSKKTKTLYDDIILYTCLGNTMRAAKIMVNMYSWLIQMSGYMSPYPTVEKVTMENHRDSNKSNWRLPPRWRCCTPHILRTKAKFLQ